MRGWSIPLKDKTLKNDVVDVEPINFPTYIQNYKDTGVDQVSKQWKPDKQCSFFVYSAFVAPGNHSFLIYIPKRTYTLRKDKDLG